MNEVMLARMEGYDDAHESDTARCPMADLEAPPALLEASDELVFPRHKRVVTQYATDEAGLTVLYLHYDDKEIVFDEPELIAFGEALAKQERFVTGDATAWGPGYEWPRVQELLTQLMEEGILRRAEEDHPEPSLPQGVWPSPLPPAHSTVARTWFECETIMRELTGHPLEVGYLELVVPLYRVAHMALDAEGRQVGEANVFPAQLRLDIPTQWRACPYAGSRYLDAKPMNTTALRSMNKYWGQMMVGLLHIREAYLQRFPQARQGWTVGHLLRLSWVVMAVPAYLLMRSQDRVENGELHPVLSSMFRVTDGIRMVTETMLYRPLDNDGLPPEAPLSGAEISAYAERNALLHSTYGVCAGPRSKIEEFLSVLVDGQALSDAESVVLDAPVQAALDDLEAAFDYCLYGLQAYAVVFSLWPRMRQAYEHLTDRVEAWPGEKTAPLLGLQERLARSLQYMRTFGSLPAQEYIVSLDRVYGEMYAQSTNGLDPTSAGATLAACIAPDWTAQHAETTERLGMVLRERFCPPGTVDDAVLAGVVTVLMDYMRQEQALVRAASTIQERINGLLGRPAPRQPLTAFDLNLFHELLGERARLPYLLDDVGEVLGLRLIVTPDTMEIVER